LVFDPDEDVEADPYVAETTYAAGDLVTSGDKVYRSLVSSNTGNTPASSPTKWVRCSGSWDDAGQMSVAHAFHYAVIRQDGVVVLAGGECSEFIDWRYGTGVATVAVEAYNEKRPEWTRLRDEPSQGAVDEVSDYTGLPIPYYNVNTNGFVIWPNDRMVITGGYSCFPNPSVLDEWGSVLYGSGSDFVPNDWYAHVAEIYTKGHAARYHHCNPKPHLPSSHPSKTDHCHNMRRRHCL
jgi:hypothetical protein